MKLKRLNQKPAKTKSKQSWLQQKVELVILQRGNAISQLLFQIYAAIEKYQYSRMRTLHMNCPILVNIL